MVPTSSIGSASGAALSHSSAVAAEISFAIGAITKLKLVTREQEIAMAKNVP